LSSLKAKNPDRFAGSELWVSESAAIDHSPSGTRSKSFSWALRLESTTIWS